MKCDNCGKNEVSFVYESNINGRITQKHLCNECARKLGYPQMVAAQSRQMIQGMRNLFNHSFGGFLDNFFAPALKVTGGGTDHFFGEDLFDDFFTEMPALGTVPEQNSGDVSDGQHRDIPISGEEQSGFARMRKLNQLRMELKKAVHKEDFEHAAELRDKIHAMEKNENQSNEK